MKLFRVDIEGIDYDQYDGFAVVAETAERAIELAKEYLLDSQLRAIEEGDQKITAEEVDINKEDVILTSFMAG